MTLPTFKEAVENGEIVNKESYHKPNSQGRHMHNCGCKKTTNKGAYRDVTVRMENGTLVYFYHQTPIVTENNGTFTLNSGGYRTSTTKERINRHIPSGYFVRQIDYDWYVETPNDERLEFTDGMQIEE